MINIDPPVFGPVRLGMTQHEAVAALRPFGALSEVGGGMVMIGHETEFGIGFGADDKGYLDWISSSRSGPLMFRGVDLAQPKGLVRGLLALGPQVICSDPAVPAQWIVVVAAEFALMLGSDWHGDMSTKRFEGVNLMTPTRFERSWRVFEHAPSPYVPKP